MSGIQWNAHDESFRVLADKLEDADAILEDISINMAEEAINLVKEGWDAQESPDGKAWAKKKADDGRAILVHGGHLKTSFHTTTDGRGFRIATGLLYASVHQNGATIRPKKAKRLVFEQGGKKVFAKEVHIPARPFLPEEGTMPAKWEERFKETADEILDEALGR